METERPCETPPWTCRPANLAEVLALRHAELRPGLPLESARFDGDEAPDTLHIGAFLPDGQNIGCGSFMPNRYEGRPAYQLRGMATRGDWVGRGVGKSLLDFAQGYLRGHSLIGQLWCNARVTACGFYQKQGWQIVSDEFDIPTVGPHYRMAREI